MSELLRMEHISKRFGNFYANQDINFSVAKGEVHTLLGENGAGKSTLMNILIGLYQPTEGKIFLNGQEVRIESPSQAVKLGIGMVHQHFMLVEAMTVFDNIILGDKHAKGVFIDRAARRKQIEALSEKYGLPVAPAALAFRSLIRETGGEALYADDRSHHSKEGSYLIACTWLDAFLDVSPVGNTYTAGLDAETVRRLQNAAEDACRPH